MEEVKIICCIPDGAEEDSLLDEIEKELVRAEIQVTVLGCRTKQEVEYAVSQEKGGVCAFIEEDAIRSEPYLAWEIAALRDVRMIPVVAVVDRRHFGTAYMGILYAAGILDAVYADEADAATVSKLIRRGRRRRECRTYYGIHSLKEVSTVLQVLEQERLDRLIQYISNGVSSEDIVCRFREVEEQLTLMENCSLVEHLPESLAEELGEDGILDRYQAFVRSAPKKDR